MSLFSGFTLHGSDFCLACYVLKIIMRYVHQPIRSFSLNYARKCFVHQCYTLVYIVFFFFNKEISIKVVTSNETLNFVINVIVFCDAIAR